jgi:cell division protein FtsX
VEPLFSIDLITVCITIFSGIFFAVISWTFRNSIVTINKSIQASALLTSVAIAEKAADIKELKGELKEQQRALSRVKETYASSEALKELKRDLKEQISKETRSILEKLDLYLTIKKEC